LIYITGDTHGEQARFAALREYGEPEWTGDDCLIVCGDFGYIFYDDEKERLFLDELEQKPYTVCFVDGNHENFPAICRYPVETWNGGKVHRIRRNVLHLMRGQVFDIDGKTFFTMGGAYSIDRYMRKEGVSYWNEEVPDGDDYREASENLKRCGHKVDYIITHTAPREMIMRMGHYPDPQDMELTGFLEWIMYEVKYKHWYCGHWHMDREMSENFTALWYDVAVIK